MELRNEEWGADRDREAVAPTQRAAVDSRGGGGCVEEEDSAAATVVTPPSQLLPVELERVSALDVRGFEGRYAVRSRLGKGGMGEVHLCRDNLIGREVALKVIWEGEGSKSPSPSRFVREARIQGQLEHPSVVPIYTLGLKPDGAAYFTMKRIRGKTLEEILRELAKGTASIAEVYSLRKLLTAFSAVCQAMDFVHSRGVVHRDLKPANIMFGSFGEVYVLDWGLAKASDELAAPEEQAIDLSLVSDGQTPAGSFQGTPGYVAPEALTRGCVLDHRADIYALGCILFEVLTLTPLHARDKWLVMMANTLVGADARASVRAPEREIPPELDAICVRATALDRNGRYPNARAMHRAIERFLDGDRDLARRREMAAQHAQSAEEAAARSRGDGSAQQEDRRSALREVGRALALDPGNAQALRTMVGLLVEPPRDIPPEARACMDHSAREQARLVSRLGARTYLLLIPVVPLFLWMGIREWTWAMAILALGGAAIAINLVHSRRPRFSLALQYTLLGVSTLAAIASSRMFGPFLLLPTVALGNTIGFVMSSTKGARWAFAVCGCLSVAVPMVLDWTGAWSPSYRFSDGGLTIRPQMIGLQETPTMVFLLLSNLAIIVAGAVFIGRVRDALAAAERRLQLYSWQLQQLLPQEARAEEAIDDAKAESALIDTQTRSV